MPVTNFQLQPSAASLHAAYRPIVFKVEATSTSGGPQPPFVACDIYIADKFYKTMLRTAPDIIETTKSIFVFDIADALQEYLQPNLASVDNDKLLQAPNMSAKVFCRFRASVIDADGFTVEETPKPVQGTKFEQPVSGSGFQSNTFFVINSALQHEDNQNLATHLNSYKKGTWASDAYPLTHRDKYFFCNDSSDHFPLIYSGDCVEADIVLNYRLKGASSFLQAVAVDLNPCNPVAYTTDVTGNRVDINLSAALNGGEKVFVRYKLQADSAWTDVGYFTTQTFFFNVLVAGDYDVEVIRFCTACISSTATADTFTIAATVNLAWRGINPYCEATTLPQPVYVELEIRDITTDDTWYPDNINPVYHQIISNGQLYAKFFSDPTHLTPLNLVQNLAVYVKQFTSFSSGGYSWEQETLLAYNVSVNGTEVFLAEVVISNQSDTYDGGSPPTLLSSDSSMYAYSPYPTDELIGGNTGFRAFADLEEYNITTNVPTGNTKPNDSGDPDYIAPVQDLAACPAGAPFTKFTYGFALGIFKVEIRVGAGPAYTYMQAPTVGDTGAGGYQYILPIPKDQPIAITIKAKSLATGVNNDGFISVVVYLDDGTNQQFQIVDNIETILPATFQAVNQVNISNN